MEYFHVNKLTEAEGNPSKATPIGKISDRRRSPRKFMDLWLANSRLPMERILDLSESGAHVRGKPVDIHAEIQLQFILPNHHAPLKATGKVVWAKSNRYENSPKRDERMGIMFTALSSEDQKTLSSFLASCSEQDVQKIVFDMGQKNQGSEFCVTDEEIDQLLQSSLK